MYGNNPDNHGAIVRETIDGMWASRLSQGFRDPGSFRATHYIITVHPSQTTRRIPEKKFASRHVFDLVWEAHLRGRIGVMEEFHYLLLASPIAAGPELRL